MFDVLPFEEHHVWSLLDEPINRGTRAFYEAGGGKELEQARSSYTVFNDGEPIFCGGIIEIWAGRGQIWCMFSEQTKRNFLPLFRLIRAHLENELKYYHRIEICVPYGFETGVRRAKMLGFDVEIECAKKFLPDGSDCTVLVRMGV